MATKKKVDFEQMATKKTILFVTTSAVNPALHCFVNMFYAQAFKQLFWICRESPWWCITYSGSCAMWRLRHWQPRIELPGIYQYLPREGHLCYASSPVWKSAGADVQILIWDLLLVINHCRSNNYKSESSVPKFQKIWYFRFIYIFLL